MDTGLSAGLHLGGRQKWVFDLTCIKISDDHYHQTAIVIFAKDTSSDVATSPYFKRGEFSNGQLSVKKINMHISTCIHEINLSCGNFPVDTGAVQMETALLLHTRTSRTVRRAPKQPNLFYHNVNDELFELAAPQSNYASGTQMASRGPGCKHGGSCRFWVD